MDMYINYGYHSICDKVSCTNMPNPYCFPESDLSSRLKYLLFKPKAVVVGSMVSLQRIRDDTEDSDVMEERNRITNTSLAQLMQTDKIIIKVQQNLDYCPQFDALIDQMTGRETLWMYARLCWIEENKIKKVVNDLIKIMMLDKHADKQTGF